MSVYKKVLFGLGGAALIAGAASGAQAHTVVAASGGGCDLYAREYAAVYAPRFGFGGWSDAYRFAYNECVTGGPDFVATPVAGAPYGYNYGLGGLLAAPFNIAGSAVHAGASVAGAAINAGAAVAGTALSIPGAVLSGTTAAFAPPPATSSALAPAAAPAADVEPVVRKNYRGTFEVPR